MAGAAPIEPTSPNAPAEPVDALFVEVYDRLKAMASRELARSDGATLNTTALVHELYMKVCVGHELTFTEPAQFVSARSCSISSRSPTFVTKLTFTNRRFELQRAPTPHHRGP